MALATGASEPRARSVTPLGGWLYSCGAGGHAILDSLFSLYLVFFLLPPVESGLPERLGNELLLFGVTAVGAVVLLGRIVDALAAPLLGWWSDRSRARWGRRRFFLATAPLPFALCTVALFLPPVAKPSALNFWWELGALALYFTLYSWYLVPYLALLPELTAGRDERVAMTTRQAALSLAAGLAVMVGVPQLWPRVGFVAAVGIACAVALVALWLPALVAEKGQGAIELRPRPSLAEALRGTLANRAFVFYLAGKVGLFTSFNVMRAVIAYYPVVLLGRPQSFLSVLMGAAFGSAALCFLLLRRLSRRLSNKALMISALLAFGVLLHGGFLLARAGALAVPLALAQMVLLGWPLAVLLAVPNAIVADLAEAESLATGERREGTYFGVQGLVVKLFYGLAVLLVGALFAAFGKDAAHPLGVQLAGSLGAVLALLGALTMARYPQATVQAVLDARLARPPRDESGDAQTGAR